MSVRPLLTGFVAVISLLVGACGVPVSFGAGGPHHAGEYREPEPTEARSPGCVMVTSMFTGCVVDVSADSPEALSAMRRTSINKRVNLSRSLAAFCPDSVASTALRAEDACVASIDARMPQATAEAAHRRTVAGPAVDALRSDERYESAREKFHMLRVQQAVACNTGDGTACKIAQNDSDGAAAVMRSLLTEHRIDPRDADALGLW